MGHLRDARGVEHRRYIRVGGGVLEVEDEVAHVAGRGVVSTLVLDLGSEPRVQGSGDVTREDRAVSERFGERRPGVALIQSGTPAPTWRIALD